jgi:branched-chain amino acid aminotransferase
MTDRSAGRTAKIWRDGELVAWEDATIHVMSHVVHYGSSVFEGIRCYETPEWWRDLPVAGPHASPPGLVQDLPDAAQVVGRGADAGDVGHRRGERSAGLLSPARGRYGPASRWGFYPIRRPVETFIIAYNWGAYLGPRGAANGVTCPCRAGVAPLRTPFRRLRRPAATT